MTKNEPSIDLTTTQISTHGLAGDRDPLAPDLYPPQGPVPAGTKLGAILGKPEATRERTGEGIDGEKVVWEGTYAMKNFVGRLTWRAIATVLFLGVSVFIWGSKHHDLALAVYVAGFCLAVAWVALAYRIIMARFGHYYRLTTRRLFVSSGLWQRRRDQVELLRISDVFTRQSWFERLLSVGTVIVVSSEQALPTVYLPGVADPKRVMDLVWHHARAERDERSVRVQDV
jgi:membrane protein YdbS with pleckstrin-like domain